MHQGSGTVRFIGYNLHVEHSEAQMWNIQENVGLLEYGPMPNVMAALPAKPVEICWGAPNSPSDVSR